MALHGHTKIELTNVKTGEIEVVEDDNLVTNALQYLLNTCSYGLSLRDDYIRSSVDYSSSLDNSYSTIIGDDNASAVPGYIMGKTGICCPNIASNLGIRLFDYAQNEDADNIYPESLVNGVTGYGCNDVNSGNSIKRGSFNVDESGPIDGGYKLVWEWTTAQANGIIASVSLTDKLSTACDIGVPPYSIISQRLLKFGEVGRLDKNLSAFGSSYVLRIIDVTNDYMMFGVFKNTSSLTLYKYKLTSNTISMVFNTLQLLPTLDWVQSLLSDYFEEEITIPLPMTIPNHDYFEPKSTGMYRTTMPLVLQDETNFYIITNFTSHTFQLCTINKSDYTTTLQTSPTMPVWFSTSTTYSPSSVNKSSTIHSIYSVDANHVAICNHKLYVTNTAGTGTYAGTSQICVFELDNIQRYKILDLADILISSGYSNTLILRLFAYNTTGDIYIIGDYKSATPGNKYFVATIDKFDNITPSNLIFRVNGEDSLASNYYNGGVFSTGSAMCITGDKFWIDPTSHGMIYMNYIHRYNYGEKIYLSKFVRSGYNVTINNITPVTKTSDKTMKITYTLYEDTTP